MKRRAERYSGLIRTAALLLAAAGALNLPGPPQAWAQPPAEGTEAPAPSGLERIGGGTTSLIVKSEPPGAVVILRGPYEWVGVTPWQLTRPLSGLYRVEARRPGYETWKAEVVLGASAGQELSITLGRKTVPKALLRSAVIPGWGQVYRGSKPKGILLLGGTIVTGGLFVWLDADYREAVDDFDAARERYEQADRLEDLEGRWNEVRRESRNADRKWDRRRVALGALAGVYAFNLLDVLFLTPGGEAETSGFSDLGTDAPRTTGLGWTATAAPEGPVAAALRWTW